MVYHRRSGRLEPGGEIDSLMDFVFFGLLIHCTNLNDAGETYATAVLYVIHFPGVSGRGPHGLDHILFSGMSHLKLKYHHG